MENGPRLKMYFLLKMVIFLLRMVMFLLNMVDFPIQNDDVPIKDWSIPAIAMWVYQAGFFPAKSRNHGLSSTNPRDSKKPRMCGHGRGSVLFHHCRDAWCQGTGYLFSSVTWEEFRWFFFKLSWEDLVIFFGIWSRNHYCWWFQKSCKLTSWGWYVVDTSHYFTTGPGFLRNHPRFRCEWGDFWRHQKVPGTKFNSEFTPEKLPFDPIGKANVFQPSIFQGRAVSFRGYIGFP